MKARFYYFNKETHKQDERAFDRIYRDLRCVTRANDPSKVLADNALTMLTNLISMLLANSNKRICVNQDFLCDITGKETDQNSNLLKQLKDIISYKYHRMARFEGKRYNYCYIIEFSQDGEKRASNPELFYRIDSQINLVRRGKKFGLIAEKIRASNIREIKREREEEPLGYSSSLSPSKHKTRAREAEIVPISKSRLEANLPQKVTEVPTLAFGSVNEPARAQDTKEVHAELRYFPSRQVAEPEAIAPSGAANEEQKHDQSHRNRESSSGLSLLQDIPLRANLLNPDAPDAPTPSDPSKDEDVLGDQITLQNQEIKPMDKSKTPELNRNNCLELSGAIFKNFGRARSDEITEHCKFTLLDSNKLGVRMSNEFTLQARDRELLKTCIRSVYGDAINIVASAALKTTQPEAQVEPQAPVIAGFQPRCDQWERFKKELLKVFPSNTGNHSISAWFDKLRVSEDKLSNRIILTGASCYIDNIYRRFEAAIEHVVKKNKVTLELHFENNDERPIIYQPNGGF